MPKRKDKTMKILYLYYRINIFLCIIYWNSKRRRFFDKDIGYIGDWLSSSTLIDYDRKRGLYSVRSIMTDICIWDDFLGSLGFDNYITEENNEYIKRTGQLEINNDEDLQFNYMLNFMKSQSKIWNLNKLVYDIETQDPQTMDEWKQSKKVLQEVIKSL